MRAGKLNSYGRRALIAALGAAGLLASGSPAAAQQRPAPAAPPAARPVAQPVPIDPVLVAKLVWSAMAALDHANQTGNYSVMRDLGAPSFQANNSAATLAGIFQDLRARQVDVANALIIPPSYEFPPGIVEGGLLRARGSFPLRPSGLAFDLLFQNVSGQWRLFGIAVVPTVAQQAQPTPNRR